MQLPRIIAMVLMGTRPEPYLPAVLASLVGAVDHIVVNDNSQQARSANRAALEASTLWREGRVDVVEAPFVNFSEARNRCLAALRERVLRRGEEAWIMSVDCDEVHGAYLPVLTRRVLPTLPSTVGIVDGYFVQFMHAFEWFISLDRRHNLLFRHNPQIAWENDVHERIHGLAGRRLCLPYLYYHYGYVTPTSSIRDKWTQYNRLGDPSYSAGELASMDADEMFDTELPRLMPYTWQHPRALAVLEHRDAIPDPSLQSFRDTAARYLRQPGQRLRSGLRKANYRVRRLWRALQALPSLSPHVWPDILRMAL